MSNAAPAAAVPGFQHRPGNHCGSTALRNLLQHHGVPISEELVFGLGAGPCFYYLVREDANPSRFTNGRTGRLEELFVELTGAPLRLRTADDPTQSWRLAAETIDAGRPAILLTDLYHLDHYGRSAHFPGHAVVLTGYDDQAAYVADTGFEAIQRTSLDGLALARHGQHPLYPLSGEILDLPAGEEISIEGLRTAAPAAIEAAAALMLEPRLGEIEGLPALRRFSAEVAGWPEAATDWRWCARFNYQVIERRGTGGGNFRAMYARFLLEVGREPEAALASRAAELWSALAAGLFAASETARPDPAAWAEIGATAGRVRKAEECLWESLAG
jgi:Butirosin biosynthesis protein H, N-terminal/Domain of unknown function (DUF4872)